MTVEETKHDLWLKRVQITIAILAGLATLILGIYNVKKNIFSNKEAEQAPPPVVQKSEGSPIKSALEETGAAWIKKLGTPKSQSGESTQK